MIGPDLVYMNCDNIVAGIYRDMESSEVKYIGKICPTCIIKKIRTSTFGITYGAGVPHMEIDRSILGTYLAKYKKERIHLENLIFETINALVQHNENVIVDGLLPRFLKKIKFDYVLYVHTDKKERRQRLLNRGVSKKRIKEIESMQKGMFREPI
jgi:dephospho-CoA kinase